MDDAGSAKKRHQSDDEAQGKCFKPFYNGPQAAASLAALRSFSARFEISLLTSSRL